MATNSMQGKVCLVTGGSSGMGLVTARELATMGARVVMLCRNRAKGEAVQAQIQAESSNLQVELIVADLSELSQVRRAAHEFQQHYSQLHVLINNAGGMNAKRKVTSDGLEATFVTNYLAPFLLTQLLLDVLKEAAPARIINVSAPAHKIGKIDFTDLQGAHHYNTLKAYSQAKLAQLYFTYELAQRLADTGVTVNALDPGHVVTNFNQSTKGLMHLIAQVIYFFDGISPEKGAQTILYLATSPEVEGVSGKYFLNCKPIFSSRRSYDLAVRQRLWNVSEALIRQPARPLPTKSQEKRTNDLDEK
jgi:NAD(P)-dependent dehydrogenase (short-subunit alcohol dehydrogenase family)